MLFGSELNNLRQALHLERLDRARLAQRSLIAREAGLREIDRNLQFGTLEAADAVDRHVSEQNEQDRDRNEDREQAEDLESPLLRVTRLQPLLERLRAGRLSRLGHCGITHYSYASRKRLTTRSAMKFSNSVTMNNTKPSAKALSVAG